MSIALFDSGVGGLTVFKELVKLLPCEDFIYLGDTARLPYGNKSRETIIRYAIENTLFLTEQNIKLLIVACNTATAHALDHLKELFNIPIVGVIESGVEKAVAATKNKKIAVLGTKGTINSGVYQQAISAKDASIECIGIACPLLAPLIEENLIDHPATALILSDYLKKALDDSVDTVVLGCTHYPLLSHVIAKQMGPHVHLVNSAGALAETTHDILSSHNLLSSKKQGHQKFFVSDDPEKFAHLAASFLGYSIEKVQLCH